MDLDAVLARKPQVCVVDELAHTNVPGSRHEKRYQDVLELLDAGISVLTAVNIQHLETLNDLVSRMTGVRVRETVPDTFIDRADEVINVDVTVEELRTRLQQGKIYKPEKIEQALTQLLPRGQPVDAARAGAARRGRRSRREGGVVPRSAKGWSPALIPERVMVCMSSGASAPRVIRTGARIASRLGARWYAVYVETPRELPGRIKPADGEQLESQHQARRKSRRHCRARQGRPAGGRVDRVRPARGHHARDLRSELARTRWRS